jgi:hypothetical protein
MWRIGWAPNNASKWQMGFNLVFKGLNNIYVFPTQSICVLYGFRKTQLLIPYIALTAFFYNQEEVCLLRGTS